MDREPASSTPQTGARASKRSRPEGLPETAIAPAEGEADRAPVPHAELDPLIGAFNGMKTMVIDTAAAKRLLAVNTGNRRISQRRVA